MKVIHSSALLSVIGFYYQGCYALIILLDCDDDRASVSVEARDDVELDADSIISLKQLKHKPGSRVNLKSDDIWTTIAIWCQHINEDHIYFHFVTTGAIDSDDVLAKLACPFDRLPLPDITIEEVTTAFRSEAKRIQDTRARNEKQKKKPGYDKRWPGCAAFLELEEHDQTKLIKRTRITPKEFQATDVQRQVELRLKHIPPRIRGQVAERLIEWWDRRLALGLLRQRERKMENSELQEKIARLIADFEEDRLIDDFQDIPLPDVIPAPSNMVRQIQWVNGGAKWINRAKGARWQARTQRDRWLKDGPKAIEKLRRFDKNLEDEWRFRFEDCQDECSTGLTDAAKAGQRVLKWSFYEAPKDVPPIQKEWTNPYLVRGAYQDMANEFRIGWHPAYEHLRRETDHGTGETDA